MEKVVLFPGFGHAGAGRGAQHPSPKAHPGPREQLETGTGRKLIILDQKFQ